ncbi:hypothetical protein B0T11DRAFT_82271 [Plectosphaerella cucumerina]|uniref:Uncharacterized protein n=1 Tax=Plectosphaerella cucumerina TaxID=40658 RepID=A0A8K0TET0_9PEZI|nr:hypothetical protein B0T11DRAFT_82271 [Plectosphaerella cucumerina]
MRVNASITAKTDDGCRGTLGVSSWMLSSGVGADGHHTQERERDNREEGYSEATPRIITVRRSLSSAADRELTGICCAGSHRVRILYAVTRRVKRGGEYAGQRPHRWECAAAAGASEWRAARCGKAGMAPKRTRGRSLLGAGGPFAFKVWFDATALPCAQGCMRERHNNTRCQWAVQGCIQRGDRPGARGKECSCKDHGQSKTPQAPKPSFLAFLAPVYTPWFRTPGGISRKSPSLFPAASFRFRARAKQIIHHSPPWFPGLSALNKKHVCLCLCMLPS